MAILATCQCGKQYRVGDHLAGKKAKCKNCGGVFAVPMPEAPAEELLDFSAMAELEQPAMAAPVAAASSRRTSARPAPAPQPQPEAEGEAPKESASNNAFYALRALLVVAAVAAVVAITLKIYIDSAKSYAQQPRVTRAFGKPVKRDAKGTPIPPKPMLGKEIMKDVWLEMKVDAPANLKQQAERDLIKYVKDKLDEDELVTAEGRTQIVASWRRHTPEDVNFFPADGPPQKVSLPMIVHEIDLFDELGDLVDGESGVLMLVGLQANELKIAPGQNVAAAIETHAWRTAATRLKQPGVVHRKQVH